MSEFRRLHLTRQQLALFLPNHEAIVEFERLFARDNDLAALVVNIIEAAGLNGDGTYNPNLSANYIDVAISLNDADLILDTEIEAVKLESGAANTKAQEALDAYGRVEAQIGGAIRYTGVVEHDGAEVTLNTDITKIDTTSCTYWLSGVKHTYIGEIAVTPTIDIGDSSFFIGLNSTGIVYSGTTWTDSQKETVLPLCRLQTVQGDSGPGSDLQSPIDQRYTIGEEGWVRRLWHEQVIGAMYYQGGEIYESTTPLQVSENAGVFYTAQCVSKTISAATDLQASQLNHVSGAWSLGTRATVVTPKFYDDGTDLVALANNKWASHTLLRSPKEDDLFILVISPAVYASEADAQAAPVYYGVFQNQALSGLYPVCHLLVKGASANVTVHDHRPVIGGVSAGIIGTASLQQIYDNSTSPEILTDTTRGALTIKRGSAADTDNVFEGLNGAGATTFAVDGDGEVSGKDFTPSDTLDTTATTVVTAINEIHTEVDLKAPAASPTFTGTVTLATILDASNLPTSDPTVAGQVWSNAGILTVSAG